MFVGRERELAVGKTSLAELLCDEAAERGALVARGPCWDAGGAPARVGRDSATTLLRHSRGMEHLARTGALACYDPAGSAPTHWRVRA